MIYFSHHYGTYCKYSFIINCFAVFELRLIYDRDKVEAIAIMCINFEKETGLYLGTSTL